MSTAIIFIQDSYYLKNTNLVLDELKIKSKIFVSRKELAIDETSSLSIVQNFFQLLSFIFKNRNNKISCHHAQNLQGPRHRKDLGLE